MWVEGAGVLCGDGFRDDVHGDRHLDVLVTVQVAVVANRHAVSSLHVLPQHLHHPVARFGRLIDEVDAGTLADGFQVGAACAIQRLVQRDVARACSMSLQEKT